MRHGLFPQDDISETNSTESRSDLSFEGLRHRTYAECIARLKETVSQTLKDQIIATSLYRYRLGGIARALLHINFWFQISGSLGITMDFKGGSPHFPSFASSPF